MNKETREQLIDECIEAIQQASKVLNENIRELQKGFSDLRDKQKYLEEWGSKHLEINKKLLIDFDNILPADLTQQMRDSTEQLRKLKADLFQYINLIEPDFSELASRKRKEIDDLLEKNGE